VVIGCGNPPELSDAVRSLLGQVPRPEIVVVNSAGGGAAASLQAAGIHVPVIEFEERLFAGAARNAGVAATGAPYVAFLASDCTAAPGWVAGRLREHRAGAAAVVGVAANADPGSACAGATHALMYRRCGPFVPNGDRVLSGLSYERPLIERLGGFRADLRAGEDTALNDLLQPFGAHIAFPSDVRTLVSHPRRPGALLRDQYARGLRTARVWDQMGRGGHETAHATFAIRNVRAASHAVLRSGDRRRLRSLLLLMPAACANAAGMLAYRVIGPPAPAPRTTTAPPPREAPRAPASGADLSRV
jgi:glycosyltransferase involved in cell wall biosynthesis